MAKFCKELRLERAGVRDILGGSETSDLLKEVTKELTHGIEMQERAGLKTEDDMKKFSKYLRRASYISNVEPSVDKHKSSGIAIGHVWANYGSTVLNNKFKTIQKAMSAMAGALVETESTGDA